MTLRIFMFSKFIMHFYRRDVFNFTLEIKTKNKSNAENPLILGTVSELWENRFVTKLILGQKRT